ncbi:ABC transporter permease [Amycolatopsis aidingensis]|uniref:ABC transporter permease n=1 Tax=Amycolatopsis aidingensis TaxID=2842453 RepID=UPI001C0BC6D5|nr:ABC transporter permease [Amycolatopsis aidingensis]
MTDRLEREHTAAPAPSGDRQPPKGPGWPRRLLQADSASVLAALIVLVLLIGILQPGFFHPGQLRDVLQSAVYVALLAAGMSFLLSMREIDLSVGSNFALSLIACGLLMREGLDPWLAALAGIALGATLGLVNALIVQVIAIPAIVATLATMQVFRGLALALSDGQQVTGLPLESSFFTIVGGTALGLPFAVWVVIAVVAVLTVVLRLTPFGYRVRSIGSNPEAATFSGISTPRTRMAVLVLAGGLAGLAGVLGLAFFTSGDPNVGTGLELQAIAAAVIGGTPLRGGSATVAGAVFGAVLLSVVASGLVYFSIPANWSAFASGMVVLLAVAVDSLLRSRRRARRAEFGL